MLNRLFKLILVALFFSIVLTSCDVTTEPESVDDPTEFTNYVLVWEDDFEQTSSTPDPDNWGYDIGYGQDGWGNDEWQLYTDAPENIRVEDGNLVISAVFDSDGFEAPGKRDGSVTSARINTKDKFSMKYGKIQARIKPPVGAGMWPAFWMLGTNFDTAGWPYCGEIDIMEMSPLYHNEKTTMFTMHWWDDTSESHSSYGTNKEFNYSLADDFHIFEVEWDAQRVVGKIDGIPYFTKVLDPETMSEFMREFFLILNVAVGGNLGGSPDDSTVWPQNMYIDWIRAYQSEESAMPIESFGVFTDETPVDAGLTTGLDANIVVWVDEWTGDLTLIGANVPPFEGDNVLAFQSNNIGWFGGGIQSTLPVDLSDFSYGNLNFMIQMPANVTFKIGIMDAQGNQSYVEFPANQTTYGLERNGEWGQAIVPVTDFTGVDISMLDYEFIILEEQGTQCTFAIDDIYYDGGGEPSSVNFNSDSYALETTDAEISVVDLSASGTTVMVSVDNGADTISLDVTLDALGHGSAMLYFGETNDETDMIAISEDVTLTASYTDGDGVVRTDTADIEAGSPDSPETPAPDPTQDAANVISLFSDAYEDVPVDTWSADWDSAELEDLQIAGNNTKLYTNLVYAGVEFANPTVDATSMSHFHMDIWTPDDVASPAVFNIKLVDYGANGVYDGGDDVEYELAFNATSNPPLVTGEWISFDLPLSDFTGLVTTGHMAQMVISGDPNTVYVDNVYFYTEGGTSSTAGIYSESHTDPMIPYVQFINSADWGGNSAVEDIENTDVTPLDGSYVLGIDFQAGGATYCGLTFDFGSVDISDYETLVFSIDNSAMTDLVHFGIKLEDNSGGSNEIDISTLTPEISGNWATYEISLSQYPATNLADLKYLGLWNPKDASETLLTGMLYLDNIYLSGDSIIPPPPVESAGIYSESHTDPMIPYIQFINSADWGGNSAVEDIENTDVPPVDGDYVLAIDFQAGGATYCGLTFDFDGVDISDYETLVFSIDTSSMTDLVHFGIKLEDNSAGSNEIDISTLTPEISDNWATYEIPLSQYPAVNLADLKYLGLWNPRDNAENLLVGTLYLDDIYLEQ